MDWSGVTPAKHAHSARTPNRLASGNVGVLTPGAATPGGGGGATPLTRNTPRDQLGINTPLGGQTPLGFGTPATTKRLRMGTPGTPFGGSTPGSRGGSTPSVDSVATSLGRSNERQRKRLRKALESGLDALPEPNHSYVISVPDLPAKPVQPEITRIPDASDLAERAAVIAEEKRQELLEKRSSAVKRGLPRPSVIDSSLGTHYHERDERTPQMEAAMEAVRKEMLDLIVYDIYAHPADGKRKSLPPDMDFKQEEYPKEVLRAAEQMLTDEIQKETTNIIRKQRVHVDDDGDDEMDGVERSSEMMKREYFDRVYSSLDDAESTSVYMPHLKRFANVSRKKSEYGSKLESRKQEFFLLRKHLETELIKSNKLQQNIHVLTKGYKSVVSKADKHIREMHEEYRRVDNDCIIYEELFAREQKVVPYRLQKWQDLLEAEKSREMELQERFERLTAEAVELRHALGLPMEA